MEVTLNLSPENVTAIAEKVVEIQKKEKKTAKQQKEDDLLNLKLTQEVQYTVNQVADMSNKTPWTVRQHIKNKLLIAEKVGKPWLISQTNYNKYINNEQ
jgi:hypothetical protein